MLKAYGVKQAYSSSNRSTNEKQKKARWHRRLFLVPAAEGSYNDTRVHTHALEPTRRSTDRGCTTKGKAYSAAVVPWMLSLSQLQMCYFKNTTREVKNKKMAYLGLARVWLALAGRKVIP